ncbi:MAG: ferredoxin [Caulobacteraceae bacterium]
MKVVVDKKKCSGHARCAAVVPEFYELDADGYLGLTEKEAPPGMEAIAQRGARACPERAIAIVEDD